MAEENVKLIGQKLAALKATDAIQALAQRTEEADGLRRELAISISAFGQRQQVRSELPPRSHLHTNPQPLFSASCLPLPHPIPHHPTRRSRPLPTAPDALARMHVPNTALSPSAPVALPRP